MRIHFKGTNYDIPSDITNRVKKKLDTVKRFAGRHADEDGTQAYVDLGRAIGAHTNGAIWRAEINLDVHGKRFTAEALEESIETAIDRACDQLSIELKKSRQRSQSLIRRGGTALKSLLRTG